MQYIAERSLFYSEKNSDKRNTFIVKLCAPYVVSQDEVEFAVDGIISCCNVEVEGIDVSGGLDHFGMDTLQAINIASNIDPLIERLSKKYDIFWNDGSPYFDD